jgi:hypothetical protein
MAYIGLFSSGGYRVRGQSLQRILVALRARTCFPLIDGTSLHLGRSMLQVQGLTLEPKLPPLLLPLLNGPKKAPPSR